MSILGAILNLLDRGIKGVYGKREMYYGKELRKKVMEYS
jgi:hypothetical protein